MEIVTEFLVAAAVEETGAAVVAGDLLGGHVACVTLIAGEARVALEESWIRSRKTNFKIGELIIWMLACL
jgi:hypothetical protein